MEATKSLLSVKSLQLVIDSGYGKRKVLKDVSFEIPYGKIVGLAGGSGSGKSLTARSILQLLRGKKEFEVSGTFTFGREALKLEQLSEKELNAIRGKRISIIFQDASAALNPVKRCGQQLEEMIRIHQRMSDAEVMERAFELLKKVKLDDPDRIFNAYPHEISGGQAQRLMIAMAIANEPELLIADEPTTGLDPALRIELMELLKSLQQNSANTSVLFISHDMDLIARYTDYTMIIYEGVLVEQNFTSVLFEHPQHKYTGKLIEAHFKLNNTKRNSDPESEDPNAILIVNNLTVLYLLQKSFFSFKKEYLKAVDDVSFIVMQGRNLGIIGPSGSGKSTIAKCLTEILNTYTGTIDYPGIPKQGQQQTDRKTLARHRQIIFQDPYTALHPYIKVLDAVMEPMKVHKIYRDNEAIRSAAVLLLERMGIGSHLFHSYPRELSGGERQRVCIARTLSLRPKILILDEAVSKLDGIHCADILDLLLELQTEINMSYIVISHDMRIIRYMCDDVLRLENGSVAFSGNVAEFKD
jgi:peptide/nickel transport system ATP-binding protein